MALYNTPSPYPYYDDSKQIILFLFAINNGLTN